MDPTLHRRFEDNWRLLFQLLVYDKLWGVADRSLQTLRIGHVWRLFFNYSNDFI